MIKVVEDKFLAQCRNGGCYAFLKYEPQDVRKEKQCGNMGCGLYEVITCPKCLKTVTLRRSS